MNIPAIQARHLFRDALVARYREMIRVQSFGRSFFKNVEKTTKTVSIEVRRGFEKVAADVQRGSDGNRNSFGKSTQKVYLPPYFREYFDLTELDSYDKLFGTSDISDEVFAQFIDEVAENLMTITDTIERAYELQAWQVLLDGIVTMNNGDNINFNRLAGSLVDVGSGAYWTGSTDPNDIMGVGAKWIREKGKATGSVVNIIMGTTVWQNYLKNQKVIDRGKIFNYSLDKLTAPAQRDSVGASFHGEIALDSYTGRIWTYPEVHDDGAGNSVPYMDDKKIIMLPESPNFIMSYAAVPQLLKPGVAPEKGAYIVREYTDEKAATHEIHVQSAGVPVPVAVDQAFTAKVIG